MKNIFLLRDSNQGLVLMIFDGRVISCTSVVKKKSLGDMAEYIAQEHYNDWGRGFIETMTTPCSECIRIRCIYERTKPDDVVGGGLSPLPDDLLSELEELIYFEKEEELVDAKTKGS